MSDPSRTGEDSVMAERYFGVVAHKDDRRTIEVYLYDHSTIVAESTRTEYLSPFPNTRCGRIIRVSADGEARAEFLARYQADRLASGLMAPTPVFERRELAEAALHENFGLLVDETRHG